MSRKATIERKTRETSISMELNLDGKGEASVRTGIRFMDHMLETLARHSLIDLKVKASGDMEVDEHHLVEDLGICLGRCLANALGEKRGIRRFGDAIVPMDEALATAGLDASGRGYLVLELQLRGRKVGGVSAENIQHFLDTLARNSGLNINAKVEGRNDHHKVEALFKALALSLREAVRLEGKKVPSTKGRLGW